jgi:hypothetical protein
MTPASLQALINAGASLTIKGDLSPATLQALAATAAAKKVRLTIKEPKCSPASLQAIAVVGKGFVTIDLT